MNKKMIATVVTAFVLGSGTALAASNPFADVSPNDWAYDAVKSLKQAGIIDGMDDSNFQGSRTMTRYEMAQIVGKAMYRSDKANAEHKAIIEKLAVEYKDELQSMGVRVSNVEKKTAGISDWKISGWAQTENTYGHAGDAKTFYDKDVWAPGVFDPATGTTGPATLIHKKGDVSNKGQTPLHEYNLEMRLAAEKQISDKLYGYYQIRTYTGLDGARRTTSDKDNRGTVETRQAWLSYNTSPSTKFTAGKIIMWDGFLHDDYLNGITVDTKLSNITSFYGATGRSSVNPDTIVNAATLSTKAGDVDLSARYLTGHVVGGADKGNIIGGTFGYNFKNGPAFMFGYANNTRAADGKDGKLEKVNLYKNIGGTDVTLRYEKQGPAFDTPIENCIHTGWWGDQYIRGLKGYRAIVGRTIAPNTYLETFYGDYKTIDGDMSAKKYGFSVQVSF
ncbi:S-layer homology domain-containing protein [Pelosinus sp. UFO1]|uniref:S-layer homology domain-containing protein n=1 Tax=Pelosinus sp. UFO1 TaxID=484770 RepID=UPI0004D0B111|nr:S-layer homology domain-containing protein [Pelosinus sp. UFO1]AIF50853.1 S-layer domain-containing protein [Pelosinus sp. UFO1]